MTAAAKIPRRIVRPLIRGPVFRRLDWALLLESELAATAGDRRLAWDLVLARFALCALRARHGLGENDTGGPDLIEELERIGLRGELDRSIERERQAFLAFQEVEEEIARKIEERRNALPQEGGAA